MLWPSQSAHFCRYTKAHCRNNKRLCWIVVVIVGVVTTFVSSDYIVNHESEVVDDVYHRQGTLQ